MKRGNDFPGQGTGEGTAWHAEDPAEICSQLDTDPASGLSQDSAGDRLRRYGPNALPQPPRRSVLGVFLRQFHSPLIYILFVAALLAWLLGERGDAAVILAVVMVNAFIGSIQESRAERSMAALQRLSALHCTVLRDGNAVDVAARDVVPGDILLVDAGAAVPADARLIEAQSLQASEAALTGESVPVSKSIAALPADTLLADRANMLFAGTHVVHGRGRAVVVATALDTAVGDIARLTATAESPRTPLERRIDHFGRLLVAAALVLFVTVMAIGLARGFPLVDILLVAISQMVSMVPEGLPVAMTIALAVGMQRMARRGAIVRRLAAVETLGSTSVICTDKTGTLTRNEMTVTALWLADGRELSVTGSGYTADGRVLGGDDPVSVGADPALDELARAAVLCNDARLDAPATPGADWDVVGDPTEIALLVLAHRAGMNTAAAREAWPRTGECPFDADTRMMATWHQSDDGSAIVAVKGAPEAVVALCGYARGASAPEPLDDTGRERAFDAARGLADRGLRVLAVAQVAGTDIPAAPETGNNGRETGGFDDLAGRATLLGLVGETDPPRDEAAAAIADCAGAGVRTMMVTGDHRATGLAIARALGIARDDQRGVDGRELERMSDEELRSGLDDIAVFARVHPAQKLRIVEALDERDHIVAMTGDGVNDAPALARADVGVAMGITGTDVAKSAADIVITDDNFSTIVGAVREGWLVYRNLKKVILYLIATSMAEILVLLTAMLLGLPLPLAAVQILWINIVTEGTVTINLIMDPPEGNEMDMPPVSLAEPIVSRPLLRRIALMTPAMAISTLGYFAWHLHQGLPFAQVQTETFTVLAACQWFNVLNCQSETRSAFGPALLRNGWLAGGLVLGISLQGVVIYWPTMHALFHTTPIPASSYPAIIATASVVLWVGELRKWFVRRRRASGGEHDTSGL